MTERSRRFFLKSSLASGGAVALGCSTDEGGGGSGGADVFADAGSTGGGVDAVLPDTKEAIPDEGPAPDTQVDEPDEGPAPGVCEDPFAGGKILSTLAWIGEGTPPMNTAFGQGLDGREYFDLEQLTPDNMITPVESFYIRTRKPDQLDLSEPWSCEVTGMLDNPFTLTYADLEPHIQNMGVHTLECSGNGAFAHFGMLSATEWMGVPIQHVFELSQIQLASSAVRIQGFDGHSQPSVNSSAGAAWVFRFSELLEQGAFLATHMGGEPLTADHGSPVRLLVPRWYGCTSVKWLEEIRFTDDSEPATSQMIEFASRTHQTAQHALASQYKPATQDVAAMPVRIERWEVDGQTTYKVVGIIWGGHELLPDVLQIRFGDFSTWEPVDVCPAHTTNQTWTLWSHQWTPADSGDYNIGLRVSDGSVPTIRLDMGFYERVARVN